MPGQPTAHQTLPPQPLDIETAGRLSMYLQEHGQAPEPYIAGKFKDRDVVFLAEDHRIKHNLILAQNLIPHLYQAGVYHFGMEFGASEDQAKLDRLVMGERYDEDQARSLMFNYNPGWAFKEYTGLYRKAWELNRTLPDHARRFRILNLSYKYDWSEAGPIRTPENTRRIFHKGGTEWYRAALVRREILDKNEKILILTGTPHAFTRYCLPVFDFHSESFYRLEDRFFGNLLYQQVPGKVFTIMLHQPFASKVNGEAELVFPAGGAIDQVLALTPAKRVGFDLEGTPLGDLPDTSYYSTGCDDFRLSQLAGGYVYEKPFREFESCTLDEKFLTEKNWPEAQKQYPDPHWHARPATLEEYWAQIRAYADIPKRYQSLR